MADSVFLPGTILSMAAGAADRLIAAGNGDAALLYLALLKSPGSWEPAKAAHLLKWDPQRVHDAYVRLVSLGLAADVAPAVTAPSVIDTGPPTYSREDINHEANLPGSPFAALVDETQRTLGKPLSGADMNSLFTIYDYVALPPEVILMLLNWCVEEARRKYGPGRMPHMPQVRKEAVRWKEQGIDTVEAADAHIKRLTQLRDQCRHVMALLDLRDRAPIARERNYISAWLSMGFDDDAIRLAYEKTIMKKNALNWAYLNSILKNWHEKGLHTLAQIQAGDHDRSTALTTAPQPQPAVPAGAADQRARDDMERMRAYMEQLRKEEN